jgi:predicted Zn finger-like uncharacterized protein
MLQIVCPQCSASYKVPDDWRGKRGRCKQCGAKFDLLESEPTYALQTVPLARDDTSPVPPPVEKPAPEAESGAPSSPDSSTPRPVSKRLKKWWKRSRLSNPSTGGWQIAAIYAGLVALVMVISLMQWLRYVQGKAGEQTHTTPGNYKQEQDANVSLMAKTSVFCLATLVCLPIVYGLWTGSRWAGFAWIVFRGLGYAAWLVFLPGTVPGWSNALRAVLVAFFIVTAISNLVGCALLTRREEQGNVGQMLLGILLIVYSEAVSIGLLLTTTGFPGRGA